MNELKDFVKKKFFCLSPLLVYKVSGKSMLPTYADGDTVILLKGLFIIKKNDVVCCFDPRTGRLLLKRIHDSRSMIHKHKEFFVVGDNERESTDSRHFGWIEKKKIIGKVVFHISN